MNGKALHVGDWANGILPSMSPLGSPARTIAGIAMAFKLVGSWQLAVGRETGVTANGQLPTANATRVAVSFVGEGATTRGEWHEAINACARRKLPAIFYVQNNHTTLSTQISQQCEMLVFTAKSRGYD